MGGEGLIFYFFFCASYVGIPQTVPLVTLAERKMKNKVLEGQNLFKKNKQKTYLLKKQ